VPIDSHTLGLISQLIADGRVRRAYLGIAGGPRPLPPQARRRFSGSEGVEVVEVVADSPADRAGLRPEDLIVDLGGMRVERVEDIQQRMGSEAIGEAIAARVLRGGRELTLALTPAELSS